MIQTITPTKEETLAMRQLRELTKTQTMLLGAAATDDVTWARATNQSHAPSYRLWLTPHKHKLVTKTVKRLGELELVKRTYSTHTTGTGYVTPTRLGWLYLAERSHLQLSAQEAHNRYEGYACPGCTRHIAKWDLIRKTGRGWCCSVCTMRPLDEEARTTRSHP